MTEQIQTQSGGLFQVSWSTTGFKCLTNQWVKHKNSVIDNDSALISPRNKITEYALVPTANKISEYRVLYLHNLKLSLSQVMKIKHTAHNTDQTSSAQVYVFFSCSTSNVKTGTCELDVGNH